MRSEPTISIVVPAYNAERYIGSTIESCLNQSSQQGWELIVVDDGSTDSTRQCVEEYQSDPRVKLLTQANAGSAAARNHAIRQAAGAYVAFLDADDYYRSGTLARFLKACDENKGEWALLYCDYERVDDTGKKLLPVSVAAPMRRPYLYSQFLLPKAFPILTSTVLARKSAIEEVGGFDERFLRCQDLELWTRVMERFPVAKLSINATCRRVHGGQVTANRAKIIHWREECNIGFLKRHDFGYFCKSSDPAEQAQIAGDFGDAMRKAAEPMLRSAAYLYETSLRLSGNTRIRTKLDEVKGLLAAQPC